MEKPRATAAFGPAVVDSFGNILDVTYNAHYLEVLVEVLSFEDAAQWEAWLASHHEQPDGVWVKIGKKGSKKTSITAADELAPDVVEFPRRQADEAVAPT